MQTVMGQGLAARFEGGDDRRRASLRWRTNCFRAATTTVPFGETTVVEGWRRCYGRATSDLGVIKVSAVADEHRIVEASAASSSSGRASRIRGRRARIATLW